MSYPFKSLISRLPDGTLTAMRAFNNSDTFEVLPDCIVFVEETIQSFQDLGTDDFPDEDMHLFMLEKGEEFLGWMLAFLGRDIRITPQASRALNATAMWLDELDHLLRSTYVLHERRRQLAA